MQYINNNSDFALDIALKAILPDGAELATAPPNCDFTLTFGTRYDEAKYEVGRYNGEPRGYTVNTDGSLHVIFDAHGLGLGRLGCMLTYGIPDSSYPDGVATVATSYELDIELIGWAGGAHHIGTITLPTEAAAVSAAQQAQAAAEQAAGQVTSAVDTANEAKTIAQRAEAKAETAVAVSKDSKAQAEVSAHAAEASQQAAEQSAAQAAQARQAATAAAGEAVQSAEAAQQSATAAAQSAEQATQTATSAAQAVERADSAIATANAATESATAAAEAATSAATNANSAADSASEYVERYDAIAGALPKVTDTFEGAAQDTGLRYVIRKNKLIAILKDGRVQYAPEGLAYVDAIAPTSFVYGSKTYEVPAGESYVELGQPALTSVGAILKNNAGIRAFGLYADTSKNTSLSQAFASTADLEWLDVSALDTAACREMSYTFLNSSSLTTLDLSGWDTAAVTNISSMFESCFALTTLDLSGWDTAAVTNMSYMFSGCYALTTLRWPMMGKVKADATSNKSIKLSNCRLDRASLDSIFSYDRTANGLTNPLTVQLSSTSKALLSAEDIAAITAKGYTIV